MLDRVKRTFRHGAIYSLSTLATKLVGFILLPLYTQKLVPAEYGIWGILEITIMILGQLLLLGQSQAFIRFYHAKEIEVDRRALFTTQSLFVFVVAACVWTVGEMLSPVVARYFSQPDAFRLYFRLLFVIVFFRMLNNYFLGVLRAKEQPVLYSSLNIAKFGVLLSANLIFLLYFQMKIEGILLAAVCGELVLFGGLILALRREWSRRWDVRILKQTIRFGAPLVIGGMAWMFLNMGDRYLLKLLTSYHQVGVYSTGYKIGNVVNILLIQPFVMSFLPLGYRFYRKKGDTRYYSKMFLYLTFLSAWVGLALALFSKELLPLVARRPGYWIAWQVVPLVCLSYVFVGATAVVGIAFHLRNKTYYGANITVMTAILNLIFNVLFIPVWGMMGAAAATLLAFAIRFFLVKVMAARLLTVPYEMRKFFLMVTVWAALVGFGLWANQRSLLEAITLKGLSLFLFPLLLYPLKFYEPVEVQTIRRAVETLYTRFLRR